MNAELLAGNIAAHWIQAGVLAAAAFITLRLLHLDEPRARLAALQLTVIAIVALPLVQPMRIHEPSPQPVTTGQNVYFNTVVYEVAGSQEPDVSTRLTPTRGGLAVIAAGIAIRLAWLFYGIITLARFSRRAFDISPPQAAADLEAELQLSPRYVQQIGRGGPWTFGFLRPTVALPGEFDALAPGFQRAVICHELLHIKRRDIAFAFLEELAVAALWFHPWMWLLRGRIRVAREQVVDSRVVAMLDNRDDYVRCLVDLSGHDLAPHFSQVGAGMLRPRELRARVDAIFQEVHMSRMRFCVAAFVFVAVTIVTGLVAVAAMPLRAPYVGPHIPDRVVSRFLTNGALGTVVSWTPAALPQSASPAREAPRKQLNKTYPEYPQDALERGIKGTVIVDITVSAAGDVTTAAVASGPQELRASAFKAALGLKYTPGSSTIAMRISVDYTLTGDSWGVRIWDATSDNSRSGAVTYVSRGPENPMPAATRVGGVIRPPRKIKDAPPVYPAIAQVARVQGAVILEARVDEDGNVSHTHVLRSIPLLDQAAIDSVKQWQYEPTLLNGSPIPVILTVTVNFSLRTRYQIQIVMADGNSSVVELFGTGLIIVPGGHVQLKASPTQEPDEITVSVFNQDGGTQLGDVNLSVGGPLVQTPTTPSIGLRFLSIR